TGEVAEALPWPSWQIPRAAWLPPGEFMEMLTPRENPKGPNVFVTPPSMAIDATGNRHYTSPHANGTRRITSLRLLVPDGREIEGLPVADLSNLGVVKLAVGSQWVLEVALDGGAQKKERDFRPQLPLLIRY